MATALDQFSHFLGEGRGTGRPQTDEPLLRAQAGMPGFSRDGFELDNGGVMEWPDGEGRIRIRDADGELVDTLNINDAEWAKAATVFGVTEEDFETDDWGL